MTSTPAATSIRIDRVGPDGLEYALPLLRAQLAEHDIVLPGEALADGLRGLLLQPERGAVLLARAGETAVGLAVLAHTWTVEHGGLVTWLDELYVIPAWRGQGIGGRLLDAAIELARTEGCIAIELEVEASHARATALYERAGFTRLPRTRFGKRLGG